LWGRCARGRRSGLADAVVTGRTELDSPERRVDAATARPAREGATGEEGEQRSPEGARDRRPRGGSGRGRRCLSVRDRASDPL